MSLLVGCSRQLKRLAAPKARSKVAKPTQKFGGKRSYSNQTGGEFPGLHDDTLSKSSRTSFTEHLDPRRVSELESNRRNVWILGGLAATAAVGYTMYNTEAYSNRDLQAYTPEVLDEEDQKQVHEKLRAVVAMCVNHSNLEADIMASPAYSALRKGVYSNDQTVRVLSLRGLAALARQSKEIRKRIATTMDFVRLASEIGATSQALDALSSREEASSGLATDAVSEYLNCHRLEDFPLPPEIQSTMMAYAFDDLVASVAFHTDSHAKLLQINYAERAAKMVKSSNFSVRSTAVRAVGGLTRTMEGRQALARTDVFPELYNLVYNEETRDKLFATDSIHFAKYAMQQLLLSESALDIMLPRYEKYFLAMTRDAKEDLLMKFDLVDDTDYAKALAMFKQAALGFGFGAVYGALKSLYTSTWVPGMSKPQIKLAPLRRIIIGAANSSTGSIPIIALYILVTQIGQSQLSRLKDSPPTYAAANMGLAAAVGATVGIILNVFPYSLVPALVGITAQLSLSQCPGTSEHEYFVASMQEAIRVPPKRLPPPPAVEQGKSL